MNRQTFLRTLAVQCLRLCNPGPSLWAAILEPCGQEKAPSSIDDLYQEAMRLGIDPASMDTHQLTTFVLEQREKAACETEI